MEPVELVLPIHQSSLTVLLQARAVATSDCQTSDLPNSYKEDPPFQTGGIIYKF